MGGLHVLGTCGSSEDDWLQREPGDAAEESDEVSCHLIFGRNGASEEDEEEDVRHIPQAEWNALPRESWNRQELPGGRN
eukprot:2349155-Rhodomonas_salina.1